MKREYPTFDILNTPFKEPISFVTVHFSDLLQHNFLTSPAVHDPTNQLIVVDNRANLFFDNLSQAMIHGVKQAKHDLVVVVHEDVVLLEGWQHKFEQSLSALEAHDPDWHIVGSAGYRNDGSAVCHLSDPQSYRNLMHGQPFHEVDRLDEHLLAFRQTSDFSFDPNMPSIHNISNDIFHHLHSQNKKGYALDAATIQKYAGAKGNLIQTQKQSQKNIDRKSLTYLAEFSICHDYYEHKWRLAAPAIQPDALTRNQTETLDRPTILLGKGGGGTRVLSSLAQDCGLFIGNKVNISGDCLEMVHTLYRAVMLKNLSKVDWQLKGIIPEIRNAASEMLAQGDWPQQWGYKLPESLFLLPEIEQAFPNARYIHFKRDPLGTVLRRSHMTARLNNHIGRVCIRAAYDYFGLDRAQALIDDDYNHMAVTTAHQLDLVEKHKQTIPTDRWFDIGFEDTLTSPETELKRMSDFLGLPIISSKTVDFVDPNRSTKGRETLDPKIAARATDLFNQLTQSK